MNNFNNNYINFKYYFNKYKLFLYQVEYDFNILKNEIDFLIDEIADLEIELNKNNIIIIDEYPKIYIINYLLFLYNKKFDCIYLLIANYVKKENNHNNYIEENNNKIIDALLFLIGACNHLNLSIFYSSSIKS